MAISKKELRKITVEDRQFYWRFNGKVFIIPEENPNRLLVVDFGWYDVWDHIHDGENRPPDFEPQIATPKFVRDSILYALSLGWNESKMEIQYKNGTYNQIKK